MPKKEKIEQRRTQAERSKSTRLKVCEATLDALVEVGYERISTPLIAQKAGISRGALTHQFPKRNDLLVDAFLYLIDGWRNQYPFGADVRPKEISIEELVDALWKNIFSEPRYPAAMELMLAARQNNELGLSLREELVAWIHERDKIAMEITGASKNKNAALFVQLNLSILRGLAMHQSFDKDTAGSTELLKLWKSLTAEMFEATMKNCPER